MGCGLKMIRSKEREHIFVNKHTFQIHSVLVTEDPVTVLSMSLVCNRSTRKRESARARLPERETQTPLRLSHYVHYHHGAKILYVDDNAPWMVVEYS